MTVFFSIDVETTGTNPHNRAHQLATVGAIGIGEDGLIDGWWYERLRYRDSWDPDTKEWWLQQNADARYEMFSTMNRRPAKRAAAEFVDWVNETLSNDAAPKAVFVANPATFDHSWIQRWLTDAGLDMPFDYRTLCLRSADWGQQGGPYGLPRTTRKSFIPHHALHDAQAQALDLIDILQRQPIGAD